MTSNSTCSGQELTYPSIFSCIRWIHALFKAPVSCSNMLQVEAKIGEYTELLLIKSSRALLAMPDHFVIHDDVHSGFGRCAHGADWRVKECMLRNHMILPDGRYRHSVLYSILDTEWADVKKKLEAMLER